VLGAWLADLDERGDLDEPGNLDEPGSKNA